MPMSDYIRGLRDRIGTTVLEVPTVSVLVFDERERILLVRHVEGNDWTTPGGMIEPYETPAVRGKPGKHLLLEFVYVMHLTSRRGDIPSS